MTGDYFPVSTYRYRVQSVGSGAKVSALLGGGDTYWCSEQWAQGVGSAPIPITDGHGKCRVRLHSSVIPAAIEPICVEAVALLLAPNPVPFRLSRRPPKQP